MDKFLALYDDFVCNSFDLVEVFILNLYCTAIKTGMTKAEAKHAVKMYIANRFGDSVYTARLVDMAAFSDFDYPGVSRDDISC